MLFLFILYQLKINSKRPFGATGEIPTLCVALMPSLVMGIGMQSILKVCVANLVAGVSLTDE